MSSIASIPSVSSALPSSGLSRIRQMLASDAVAVQPVRRVPGDQERQKQPSANVEATDDALKNSGRADETGSRRAQQTGSSNGFAASAGGASESAVAPGMTAMTTTPNAGFVAQSIHQDSMGSGLHIEPWTTAIQAYRKASAGPDNGSMLSQVRV